MKRGIAALVLAYGLSQFFRAFLPVLAPVLARDIGATPGDLGFAAGIWFIVFAAMQLPVGAALDRIGPRWTASVLFGIGGAGGALAFALAQTPVHLSWAMALIGIGCSPVLMAGYFIFARVYPAAIFATLAGAMIGLGSFGNLAGSVPLALAVEQFGWRVTMLTIAGLSLCVALALALLIRDPDKIEVTHRGSVLDVLRLPVMWPIFAIMLVSYAPAATLRSLWAGPYLADVFGADTQMIGQVTLVMGLAMIAGSFAYGPMDRLLGTRKWIVVAGNVVSVLALSVIWMFGPDSLLLTTTMFAVIGFAGSCYGLIIAHGRAFLPAHLTGRGVTLLNLVGIGGAGLAQLVSGPLFRSIPDKGSDAAPYNVLLVMLAAAVTLGLLGYLFARDNTD